MTSYTYTLARLRADAKTAAILNGYGPKHIAKFLAASWKYRIDLDEVIQLALLVHIEKMPNYENKEKLENYLWGHLNGRLMRASFGVSKYAISASDDDELGIKTRRYIQSIVVENNDRPDWKIEEISQVPDLVKLKEYAESISGKSTKEIALECGITTRRVNQILQEKIALAKQLRKKINKHVAPKKKPLKK